ncbi:cytochrome c maturation protein CcmE [Aquabacterium soli]|uniref:Cytochrome c-type biogenesis protein CcmE n=1 Tax=Aquabacterium soli TaxID=2493092 RepID=A0A426V8T3_9BURK|nr:cytochrome c maturation protein CcmE [Aquabacterium soli]RRS03180.1 cytochrome c maturation protein CcmE [Aquabacterium soli]
MKSRHKRLLFLLVGLAVLSVGAWLVLSAFQKNLVFFFTPSQIVSGEAPRDRSFRIGGMVERGSLRRQADGLTVNFIVTDMVQRVAVSYRGILPDLFKEGKGVVAQGRLGQNAQQLVFLAEEVLAKHDENYMPPEAAHALEQARQQSAGAATPPQATPPLSKDTRP